MGGGVFQALSIIMFMAAINSYDVIVLGLAFLEVEPSNFYCYQGPNSVGNPSSEGQWTPCTKDDVCSRGLSHDEYRVDESDPDYIYNWVEKYDILCTPKTTFGLFGLYFFYGLLSTVFIFPKVSDMYGRKFFLVMAMVATLVAQIVLIVND